VRRRRRAALQLRGTATRVGLNFFFALNFHLRLSHADADEITQAASSLHEVRGGCIEKSSLLLWGRPSGQQPALSTPRRDGSGVGGTITISVSCAAVASAAGAPAVAAPAPTAATAAAATMLQALSRRAAVDAPGRPVRSGIRPTVAPTPGDDGRRRRRRRTAAPARPALSPRPTRDGVARVQHRGPAAPPAARRRRPTAIAVVAAVTTVAWHAAATARSTEPRPAPR